MCVKIPGTGESWKTKEEACKTWLLAIQLGTSQPGSSCELPDKLEQVPVYAMAPKDGRIQNFV